MLVEEMIIVVDEQNNNPQEMARSRVVAENLLHRSSIVYLFNSRGELFLQKRVSSKQAYPDHWDCSCAGAVDWNETYLQCAARELEEEVGVKLAPEKLTAIGEPFRVTTDQTDEFDQLFSCQSDDVITLQKSEVADGKWLNISDIPQFLNNELVTPWFVKSWELFNHTTHHAYSATT
jgi:isopentenyl-diphosphate delta-isomerase